MGSGVSAGLAAAIVSASNDEIQSTMTELTPDARAKLKRALQSQTEAHVAMVGFGHNSTHMQITSVLVQTLVQLGCKVTHVDVGGLKDLDAKRTEALGARTCSLSPAEFQEKGIMKQFMEQHGIQKPSMIEATLVFTEFMVPTLVDALKAQSASVIVYDTMSAMAPIAGHLLGIPAIGLITMPGPGTIDFLHEDESQDIKDESKPSCQALRKNIVEKYGYDPLKRGANLFNASDDGYICATINELYSPPATSVQKERFGGLPCFLCGPLISLDQKLASADTDNFDMNAVEVASAKSKKIVLMATGVSMTQAPGATMKFLVQGNCDGTTHVSLDNKCLSDCTQAEYMKYVHRTCFEALGGREDLFVIAAAGPLQEELAKEAPDNFLVARFVPQASLLRVVDAFITHAGASSMHEALSFGVPLIAIPHSKDQPVNADRIAACGAGKSFRFPLKHLSAESLRAAVLDVLPAQSPEREAAKKLQEKLRSLNGAKDAAAAILNGKLP